MLLSKQSLTNNLRQWGFVSYDAEVHKTLDNALQHFANKKVQKGGRVTLPLEYFGVNTGKYISDAPGPSLAVTEQWIRPPASASDPTGVITGGAARRFRLAQTAVNKMTNDMNLTGKEKLAFKNNIENRMTKVLTGAAKREKNDHLTHETLEAILNQKQHQ